MYGKILHFRITTIFFIKVKEQSEKVNVECIVHTTVLVQPPGYVVTET